MPDSGHLYLAVPLSLHSSPPLSAGYCSVRLQRQMRLNHWSRAKLDVDFDPATGTAGVIRLSEARPDNSQLTGFAACERRLVGSQTWFAIFRDGEGLVFSAGPQHWRLGAVGVEFKHRRLLPFVSQFQVYEDGRSVYSITYTHFRRLLFAIMDPTYDKIDQESDYFLEFVAENANDDAWQENVKGIWSSDQRAT